MDIFAGFGVDLAFGFGMDLLPFLKLVRPCVSLSDRSDQCSSMAARISGEFKVWRYLLGGYKVEYIFLGNGLRCGSCG